MLRIAGRLDFRIYFDSRSWLICHEMDWVGKMLSPEWFNLFPFKNFIEKSNNRNDERFFVTNEKSLFISTFSRLEKLCWEQAVHLMQQAFSSNDYIHQGIRTCFLSSTTFFVSKYESQFSVTKDSCEFLKMFIYSIKALVLH